MWRRTERRLPERDITTLLTETVVDPDDPAFAEPTKPIGPIDSAAEGSRLRAERGWTVGLDGDAWHRLAPCGFWATPARATSPGGPSATIHCAPPTAISCAR